MTIEITFWKSQAVWAYLLKDGEKVSVDIETALDMMFAIWKAFGTVITHEGTADAAGKWTMEV